MFADFILIGLYDRYIFKKMLAMIGLTLNLKTKNFHVVIFLRQCIIGNFFLH